jgi:hypothetical protein
MRNDNGNQNDVLRVKAIGTKANRDGIGAKVTVTNSKGQHLSQMVKGGSSYLSQSELTLTFGLGKPQNDRTLSLDIVWPGGKKEFVKDIKPNEFLTLVEGSGVASRLPIKWSDSTPHPGRTR